MTPEQNRKRINALRAEEGAIRMGSKKTSGHYDAIRRQQEIANRALMKATA